MGDLRVSGVVCGWRRRECRRNGGELLSRPYRSDPSRGANHATLGESGGAGWVGYCPHAGASRRAPTRWVAIVEPSAARRRASANPFGVRGHASLFGALWASILRIRSLTASVTRCFPDFWNHSMRAVATGLESMVRKTASDRLALNCSMNAPAGLPAATASAMPRRANSIRPWSASRRPTSTTRSRRRTRRPRANRRARQGNARCPALRRAASCALRHGSRWAACSPPWRIRPE